MKPLQERLRTKERKNVFQLDLYSLITFARDMSEASSIELSSLTKSPQLRELEKNTSIVPVVAQISADNHSRNLKVADCHYSSVHWTAVERALNRLRKEQIVSENFPQIMTSWVASNERVRRSASLFKSLTACLRFACDPRFSIFQFLTFGKSTKSVS
jgi:hypothetical protein